MNSTEKNEEKRVARGVDVLTAGELARWLRIPKSTVYKLCQEGKMAVKKVGRHWRFDRIKMEEWFQDSQSTSESKLS